MPADRLSLLLVAAALAASGASPVPTSEELAARRTLVDRMEPSAQQDLLRRFERFSALPAEEQQRLRTLESAIGSDPNSKRLYDVLGRYHEWLKTISSSQRAMLAELPPKKRVDEIARIVGRQRDEQQLELLSRQDMREITRWIDELVQKNRQELVAGIPKRYRAWYDKETDPRRKQMALRYRMFGRSGGDQHESLVTQDDIDGLAKKLSEPARTEIGKAPTLDDQRKIVNSWVFATLRRSDPWQGGRRANLVVGEELLEFLQNEVAPAKREQLLKLPREEMLRELRKMYFERGSGDGRFSPGRRSDNSRGPNRSKGPRSDAPQDRPPPDEPGPSDSAPIPFFN